jgi:hypothetical protein
MIIPKQVGFVYPLCPVLRQDLRGKEYFAGKGYHSAGKCVMLQPEELRSRRNEYDR